jgi:hypothetical protein
MSREELKKILDGFYGSEKEKAVEYIISWRTHLGIFRWSPSTLMLVHVKRHTR